MSFPRKRESITSIKINAFRISASAGMTSMKYTTKQYAEALYEILKDQNSHKKNLYIANFIKLLKLKKDFKKMRFIESELMEIERKEKNIADIEVFSPFVLSAKTENEVKKIFSSFVQGAEKDFRIKNKISEDLIGGFKAYYGGYLIDASIKNLLLKLKKNFTIN